MNQSVDENEEPVIFPPSESMIRQASNLFILRFQAIEEAERCISAGSSPIKEESKNDIIDEFSQVQGAVTTIVTALHQAADEVQLDLMETLSILLEHNVKNQKEFKKVEGYDLICDCFNKIKAETPNSIEFLEGCFKILKTIILDGRKSDTVGNLRAFKLLLNLASKSTNFWIVKGAIIMLRFLLEINWENVLCFYENENLDDLSLTLQRIIFKTENPIRYFKNDQLEEISADQRLEILKLYDDLLKNLSFIMGNSWEKNTAVIKIYSNFIKMNLENLEKSDIEYFVNSLSDLISDINVRCFNRTSLAKNTFFSLFEGMKVVSSTALEVLSLFEQSSLPLLANLIQFELIYTEIILSSPIAVDNKLTLFSSEQVKSFEKLRKYGPSGEWIFERSHMMKIGVENISDNLIELIQNDEVNLVTKILMLDDYPNINKIRGYAARDEFLSKGLEIIIANIKDEKYQDLLIAATQNSSNLKLRVNKLISHTDLANSLALSLESLHLLLDLSIESGYLEQSGYLSQILSSLPIHKSDLIHSVVHPKFLFDLQNVRASTAPGSSIAMPSTPTVTSSAAYEQNYTNLHLLNSPQIIGMLLFLIKSPSDIQIEGFKTLISLSKNYENKRILHLLQFSKNLLRMIEDVPSASCEYSLKLLECLLSYSTSKDEAEIIIRIIRNESHPLNTQIDSILTKILHLDLASSFYHLNNSRLDSPNFSTFPKNGYTLSF